MEESSGPTEAVSQTISESPNSDEIDLADARLIHLTREAGSAPARALSADVSSIIAPLLDRKRPIGAKGMASLRGDVGTILGGRR